MAQKLYPCSVSPATQGIFGSVVVSRGAVEEPSSVPATQTYSVPSQEAVRAVRHRRARYSRELAHAEDDDLPDAGDGKERITHLMCGDLGDDDDTAMGQAGVGLANEQLWYARFSVDDRLYHIQLSSLDEGYLEDIMDKCRNNIHT